MNKTPPYASGSARARRQLRRYPVLESIPEDERPAVVRAALRHPVVLFVVCGAGLLLLPVYFDKIFFLLDIEQEVNPFLMTAKLVLAVFAPCLVAVPLLSRLLIPVFIRREIRKRGYSGAVKDPDLNK